MKKIILTLGLVGALSTISFAQEVTKDAAATPSVAPQSQADIKFDKMVHDYGTIKQGDNGECVFKFKNTGKEPLIISMCQGSCGCTVPQCPKEPILPGKTGEIKVKYDTQRVGPISKSVTVQSNAKSGVQTIQIKGNIEPKPVEEPFPANKPSQGAPLEKK
ncbi:MAG: DUF1573 domain-containing protein [Bacteroidetes bacterium]|nr:DUF1573 domain-containing protein [Bacteroidota bacterium]